jgi:2-polyprenyl-3-methyl-5-hydroxy-6-metoxy-1,4-benzoquinol methylase
MEIKAEKDHVDFYNTFYKTVQQYMPSWYIFMLPELIKFIEIDSKILEIGCGQSKGLRYLVKNGYIKEGNVCGIDQSNEAINFLSKELPHAKLSTGDAYHLKFDDNSFEFILLMETIEHFEYPEVALKEIHRVLEHEGKVFISFPNFINFPWLLVRILSEKLNKPNWINLQPVDKIYTTLKVISLCKKAGLRYEKCIGSNYLPPPLYTHEKIYITKTLNKIGLNHLAFHPILVFSKNKN